MPLTKINRNTHCFERVAEQDITLDFEAVMQAFLEGRSIGQLRQRWGRN